MPSSPRHNALICTAILAAACSQWAFSAGGLAVPLGTVVLFIAAFALFIVNWRTLPRPALPWPQAGLMALACVGLLGLDRAEAGSGAKELVRLAEIFAVAWYAFTIIDDETFDRLVAGIGVLCLVLVLLGFRFLGDIPGIELSDTKHGALVIFALPFLMLWTRSLSPAARWGTLTAVCVLVGVTFQNGGLVLVFCITLALSALLLSVRRRAVVVGLCALTAIVAAFVPAANGESAWATLSPRYSESHRRRLFIEYDASLLAPAQYPLGGGLGEYRRAINVLRQEINDEPDPAENKIPESSNNQYLLTMVEAGVPAALALVFCFGAAAVAVMWGRSTAPPQSQDRRGAVAAALIGVMLAALFCTVLSRGIGIWVGALLGLAARERRSVVMFSVWPRWVLPVSAAAICFALMFNINTRTDTIDSVSVANKRARGLFATAPARTPGAKYSLGGLEIVELRDDAIESAKPIRIEAENWASMEGSFQKIPANDASGNMALLIPLGAGKGAGQASYSVEIPAAGKYILAARVLWEDGCSNSIGFTVSSQKAKVASEQFHLWHELECRKEFDLPAGNVRVIVRNLEENVRLDYLELRRR